MTTLLLSVCLAVSASAYDVEVDGIYYEIDGDSVLVTSGDKSYSGDIVIPESIIINDRKYSVTSIGDLAFYECTGLTSVTIPNSVTSIGGGTFHDCSGLTSVTIPNSVTSIGDHAFYWSGLTSVTIPNSVTSIGSRAFSFCTGLTSVTIPNSVTSIGDEVFYYCSGLTSVTIPNSVTSIGDNFFYGCSGLTSVTIPNSVTSIGDNVFYGCSSLTSVTIPNSVTSIGEGAFRGCSGLTSVTIPNSVTSIGNSAFSECSGLTSVTIPNSVTSIELGTFYGCSGLTSVTIPNSVTSIGVRAFYACRSLTSVTIPNSVTSIGVEAFSACSGLTSVTIPNSVTIIASDAFDACYRIETLYFDSSVNPKNVTNSLKELYIGDNVSIVYDYFNRYDLRKVVLGKNVTHIRPQAFSNSQIEEFTITGEEPPYLYPNVFGTQDLSNATLYVPESKAEYYQTTEPWSKFGKILTLSGDTPSAPEKCATPTISYSDGKLQFSCETEGAKCNYTVSCPDAASGETSTENNYVNLNAYYDITCYAKAEGYVDSDAATAKLYWLPSSGSLEGNNINAAAMRGIAIQSASGFITITGLDTNEKVDFYATDGKALGSAKSTDGSISFSAKQGSVVVARIGSESVKIAVE